MTRPVTCPRALARTSTAIFSNGWPSGFAAVGRDLWEWWAELNRVAHTTDLYTLRYEQERRNIRQKPIRPVSFGFTSTENTETLSMRAKTAAVLTSIAIIAGMTTNAEAFRRTAPYWDLDTARGGLHTRGLGELSGYRWAQRGYGHHFGYHARSGLGFGLGIFGYDDRYCSASYHACDAYGQ